MNKKTNDDVKAELTEVYGTLHFPLSTMKYWTAGSKRDSTGFFEEVSLSPPNEVISLQK